MTAEQRRDAYRDELTHVDEKGEVRMVDVSQKASTARMARAEGSILMHPETQAMVMQDRAKKGDVLACARVAGIMASKRTSDLIPMCHPLNMTSCSVDIEPIAPGTPFAREDGRVGFHVGVECGVNGVTGIEMEALTAASVACLTIYDMCKAVDRGMEVVDVRLVHKEGGRSGVWERAQAPAMPLVPAVSFVGYHNAGKTMLVTKVIQELVRRGLRVGSIKHHGHAGFEIDQEGKDSWRHTEAGSAHVGLICQSRYAEYAQTDEELPLAQMLARFTDVDVVIVEGYKNEGLPNVVVGRSGVDRQRGESTVDLIDGKTLALACNDVLARRAPEDLLTFSIDDGVRAAEVVLEQIARLRG